MLVCGSHGGAYAGYLAAISGVRAVVLNDAGVGLGGAGIASLELCDSIGMAAATVAYDSARIGDAEDMHARGLISHVNATAASLGVKSAMTCAQAIERLGDAPSPKGSPSPFKEARKDEGTNAAGLRIVLVDSVSLVTAQDEGQIVVSGSHGGLVAGQHNLAIKVPAAAAFYNDAGIGIDEAGVSRLPVLDRRGIAAATVGASTARIGDGLSTYTDGIVSRANEAASRVGIVPGMSVRQAVEQVTGGTSA